MAGVLLDFVANQTPDFPLAKCKGVTHDLLFFPPRDRTSHRTADRSKAMCWGDDGFGICPHLVECAAWALDHKQRHGIWGGMSERDRARVRRKAREVEAGRKAMKLSEPAAIPEQQPSVRRVRRRVIIGRTHARGVHAA